MHRVVTSMPIATKRGMQQFEAIAVPSLIQLKLLVVAGFEWRGIKAGQELRDGSSD